MENNHVNLRLISANQTRNAYLCADAVDGSREVAIGYCRVPGLQGSAANTIQTRIIHACSAALALPYLYRPQRLAEPAHRGGRVEYNLGSVQAKRAPVQGVMAPVADIYANPACAANVPRYNSFQDTETRDFNLSHLTFDS
jgi:hypothetical protein